MNINKNQAKSSTKLLNQGQ